MPLIVLQPAAGCLFFLVDEGPFLLGFGSDQEPCRFLMVCSSNQEPDLRGPLDESVLVLPEILRVWGESVQVPWQPAREALSAAVRARRAQV